MKQWYSCTISKGQIGGWCVPVSGRRCQEVLYSGVLYKWWMWHKEAEVENQCRIKLLLSKSTKGATMIKLPIWWTNHYQHYLCLHKKRATVWFPFQKCWSIHIYKLPDATPIMSATNLKQDINPVNQVSLSA